jgi:ribosomal protein S3
LSLPAQVNFNFREIKVAAGSIGVSVHVNEEKS